MKTSIIASIIALTTSVLAAPMVDNTPNSNTINKDTSNSNEIVRTQPIKLFTFNIYNDVTGQYAWTSVGINSPPASFKDLFYPWADNLISGNMLLATSATAANDFAAMGAKCTIKGWGRKMELSDTMTFAELDNAEGEAHETDVTDFTIECKSV